jgi:hypothetical protein
MVNWSPAASIVTLRIVGRAVSCADPARAKPITITIP